MLPVSVFSVDLEDYFHVEAFADVIDRARWSEYPCRVEASTLRILDLLDRHSVKATFFILGWVAERYPQLIREIIARGHEPACHSYWHRLIYRLTPDEFREDTMLAKTVIEQAGGVAVRGYRAPSYSITRKSLWALDILAECGFAYDSSIFPISHDVYGIPDAPRTPFSTVTSMGSIVEYPITTFRLAGKRNWPVGGGGYLRIFPTQYTRMGIQRASAQGIPLIVYIHPWEIDSEQPKLPGRFTSRLRHYTNLTKMYERVDALLASQRFGSFQDIFAPEQMQAIDGFSQQ